uniref:Uncharacterized protein n=1 Tax=Arundo donax TaxID=35708 RepID=A0A0A8ZIG1_ARUDO
MLCPFRVYNYKHCPFTGML